MILPQIFHQNVNKADLIKGKGRAKQWRTIIWMETSFFLYASVNGHLCKDPRGWAAPLASSLQYWGKPLQIQFGM